MRRLLLSLDFPELSTAAASHSRKFTCLGKSNSTKAYLIRGNSRFRLHWEFPVTLTSTRSSKQSHQISLAKTFRKHLTPMEAPYSFLDYQFKPQNNFQGSPPHFGSHHMKPLAESYAARMWLNMSRWQMSTMSLEIGANRACRSPPSHRIYPHNEFGLSPHFPAYIFFCCLSQPDSGGETPINNSLILYHKLKAKAHGFINKLEAKVP
jgi:hypothetical protein